MSSRRPLHTVVGMPRYLVERTIGDGNSLGDVAAIVARNADGGVTWLHSYVSDDASKTFCLYEAPTPEAIRKAAALNRLAVDRITLVRVLHPYDYRPRENA
jgi:hypothetical protein